MNFLAHGLRSLGDPWECAGTAAPDWARILRTGARIAAAPADGGPHAAAFARGVARHHRDDIAFHASAVFADVQRSVSAVLAPVRRDEPRFRARFAAHLAVEVLLDAWIEETRPGTIDRYYETLAPVEPDALEALAVRASPAAAGIGRVFAGFRRSQFLREYADDARAAFRISQVTASVGVPAPPELVAPRLAEARTIVRAVAADLLATAGPESP